MSSNGYVSGFVGDSLSAQQAQQARDWSNAAQHSANVCAQKVRDKPMMDVEYDRLSESLAELDASVAELIGRIQPVCQPGEPMPTTGACLASGVMAEAQPSEMRSKLLGLRLRVQATSSRIAAVRYALEI
jgi:hypothetical protein